MTTELTAAIGTISKIDIQAMKLADTVSFHRVNGKNTIVATKRVPKPKAFEDTERRHEIEVDGHVDHFRGDGEYALPYDTIEHIHKFASCFDMIHSSQYSDEWQTIVSILRPGDVISLVWQGADNNGYLNNAQGQRLYPDKLYLKVKRDGKRDMSFYLTDSICPNNTARMIRPS
jgi:hypothetical protein